MKIEKNRNNGATRLLLFFAGWSASPHLFKRLEAEADTDVWICYNYRTLAFEENLSIYCRIDVIAWSLGVWVADRLLSGAIPSTLSRNPNLRNAIAINGTSLPQHDTSGIPPAIFQGTLDNINEEGMKRFNRRMCGNKEVLVAYETVPGRQLNELYDELLTLSRHTTDITTPSFDGWTLAVVSTSDRIFPASNQHHFWQGRCPVKEIAAPHYPFYLWKQWNEIEQ